MQEQNPNSNAAGNVRTMRLQSVNGQSRYVNGDTAALPFSVDPSMTLDEMESGRR